MRTRKRVTVQAAVAARQLAQACMILTLAAGCVTTPKERRVTTIYRDAGDGLRLAASVEQESAQQLGYRLLPLSYLLFWFPPLCFGTEWEIRRKENLVYRRGDAEDVIREEREVRIEATKTFFPWLATPDLIRLQEVIFRHMIVTVNEARRNAAGTVAQEVLCEDVLRACEPRVKTGPGGESRGDAAEDEALVRMLSQLPYTVERADLFAAQASAAVSHTLVQVSGPWGYRITTTTTTVSGPMPFVDPNATFNVRIVRRFTAAKSGKLLGTVDDTYVLHTDQKRGDGVRQTLMK